LVIRNVKSYVLNIIRSFTVKYQKIVYGKPSKTFTNLEGPTFTDTRDNNEYTLVEIGNQVWMAENLAYLPFLSPPSSESYTQPYYYVNGYEGTSVSSAKFKNSYKIYGVLYNWPAAMNGAVSSNSKPSGVQGVCPDGWHLPSTSGWNELINYLGGWDKAGVKLKGLTQWADPNNGATNSSGLTALPGGSREYYGYFGGVGGGGLWWSVYFAIGWSISPFFPLYRIIYLIIFVSP
jgi:uncharacterized protein (TIGR02145 family)